MVVKHPKFTRVEEPTLLCNQVKKGTFALSYPPNAVTGESQAAILAEKLKK
jgi:hypothetical protein